MNIYHLDNGDIELADWIYRRSHDWVTLIWNVTEKCNFSCPYCIGRPVGHQDRSLENVDPIKIIQAFEDTRKIIKKDIFITLTGGEPTLAHGMVTICKELSHRGFKLDLMTNACSPVVHEFINSVDPCSVSISMSYHMWKLDKDRALYDRYMTNFHTAWNRGITTALKIIASPEIIPTLEKKINKLRVDLPSDAPILIQNYIEGWVWPKAYTREMRDTLLHTMKIRRNSNIAFWDVSGFKGMKCDAGNSLIFMNTSGDFFPCFGIQGLKLGNLMDGNLKLTGNTISCPNETCSCTQHGIWYGKNPWDFIKGQKYEDATYNRFGPGGIKTTE